MNPLVFLPLLAAVCSAAPTNGEAAGPEQVVTAHLPVVTHQEVKAHVPAAVEYHSVGHAVAVPHAVVPAVPGYKVDGKVTQVTQTVEQPEEVAVDVNTLPVLAGHTPYASPYHVPYAHLPYALPHTPIYGSPAHFVSGPIPYSNVNLNVPASVPAGDAPPTDELVQTIPVKVPGRPVVSYTPQVTKVLPEVKVYEKTFDVHVPKPVYGTEVVTPVHHKYVAQPYVVPRPYYVQQPYAVPQPYHVHHPFHVHHQIAAVQPTYDAEAEAEAED